ncbi:MAG: ABC transporter permease [Acidobacteria bacterium]|nr:ABC transporter permease [Acidobacteriota bacterium]
MRGTSTLRIAWRNLWRSRRRTGLALAAIGLSVTLVLSYDAILRAYEGWIVETVTGPMIGHVQIHAAGWRKDRAMDRALRGVSRAVAALRADPLVAGASARLYAPALAALAEEGFGVVVFGVDPAAESGPQRLLSDVKVPLGQRRVLMGRPLARLMGARPGDTVALVGQGADGSLANDLFTIADVIETPVDLLNRQGIIMDLGDAQELFAMPDEAHEIVIHARDAARAKNLVAAVAGRAAFSDAEVLDWQTLAPEMLNMIKLVNAAGIFALVLVFVAAAAGVANTMLMSTFERTHEFGMLLALGTGPWRIIRMIVTESIVLGIVGALAGAALGIGLVALTHRGGIDFAALTGGGPSEISFAGLRWSMRFYPSLALADVAQVVAAVIVTSLVASVWPAARAARLLPAQAMRD